jgi:MoaE-MoaD fusion protein
VADVWRELKLGDEPPGIAYARNREYASRDTMLADGDEVALIPPVSGGAFRVTDGPLDLGALVEEVRDPSAGAIATFVGTTRDHSRGRTVTHLEYDAYPEMAEAEMARIATALADRHAVTRIAMAHRTGHVPIGEASVMIAVSAPHRAAALEACREAIDTLKQTVPVWKKEVFEGGEEWIGREGG